MFVYFSNLCLCFSQAKPEKLISHLVEDHSVIDPTFVEDFLLTFKTYFDQPTMICGKLLTWFLSKDHRDKVKVLRFFPFFLFDVNVWRVCVSCIGHRPDDLKDESIY